MVVCYKAKPVLLSLDDDNAVQSIAGEHIVLSAHTLLFELCTVYASSNKSVVYGFRTFFRQLLVDGCATGSLVSIAANGVFAVGVSFDGLGCQFDVGLAAVVDVGFANLEEDSALLESARDFALQWLAKDPESAKQHARRWFSGYEKFLEA